MNKNINFKNGGIANIRTWETCDGNKYATLIIMEGGLLAGLADKIDGHKAIDVLEVRKSGDDICLIDMEYYLQPTLLLEAVADVICCVYQTDVTISDAKPKDAV